MGNSVRTMGWVIRNWPVDVNGDTHWVQLRHHTPSASFSVYVDGVEVAKERKLTKLGPIQYAIGSGTGEVIPSIQSYAQLTKGFTYECTYEGKVLKELMDGVDAKPLKPRLKFKLLPSAVIKKMGEKKVVYYKIEVRDGEPPEAYILKKRFSEFEMLDHLIRSSFSGSHLQSNLPDKPAKSVQLWTDHLDRRFVHLRKNELQKYLERLQQLKKVAGNPDFARFFDKVPGAQVVKSKAEDKKAPAKKQAAPEV